MTQTSRPSQNLRWLWLGILVLAIGSRLLGLAATPLSPRESEAAVSAWDVVRSEVWPPVTASPLLLTGQTFLFALFGPNGITARLLPALAGVLLVGLPLLWRKSLGNLGALVASGLLLASPLSLYTARQAEGTALAVLGGVLIVTVVLQALAGTDEDRDTRGHEALLALGVMFGLTGGPAFYDVALAGCVACWIGRRAADDHGPALNWRRAALIGLGLGLVVSVAFGLRWSGWAGITEGAAAWSAEWRTPAERDVTPLSMLLLYEPFLLIAALTGLGVLVTRKPESRQHLPQALAVWAAVTTILVAGRPGSRPEALYAVIPPLALLSGYAAQQLWAHLAPDSLPWMRRHVLISGLFWTPGLLALAQHTNSFASNDQIAIIILGLVVLAALQALLILIFLMHLPGKYVWRSALLGTGTIFLFLQLSFASGLAFIRSDSATEPAIQIAGSRDLQHLRQVVNGIAITQDERPDSLDIVIIDKDPDLTNLVRWTLRDFDNLRSETAWPTTRPALVISPSMDDMQAPNTAEAWQGLPFVAMTRAASPAPTCRQLVPLDCQDAVGWYLYRQSPTPTTATFAILWQASAQEN